MSTTLHLRVPPLAVTVMAGGVAWAGARVHPEASLDFAARPWLALGFAAVGVACILWGVASFRRAGTTVNPLRPDAATSLVVSGIYRLTRNPMYLGFLFLLVAEIVWLAHPMALLAAPAFVSYLNSFQIVPEEEALRRSFGMEYLIYATRVRRWI